MAQGNTAQVNMASSTESQRALGSLKVAGNILVTISCLMLFICTTSLTAGIINHFVAESLRSGRGAISMILDFYCFTNVLLWILVESVFAFLLAGSLTALFSSIFTRPRGDS